MPAFMNTVKDYVPGGLRCEKIRQLQVNIGRRRILLRQGLL